LAVLPAINLFVASSRYIKSITVLMILCNPTGAYGLLEITVKVRRLRLARRTKSGAYVFSTKITLTFVVAHVTANG
jgi:hypothetical protein